MYSLRMGMGAKHCSQALGLVLNLLLICSGLGNAVSVCLDAVKQ